MVISASGAGPNGAFTIATGEVSPGLVSAAAIVPAQLLSWQMATDRGYDPVYGARPLKRVIQRELQNPLAQQILEGRIPDGATVRVTASPLGLVIGDAERAAAA